MNARFRLPMLAILAAVLSATAGATTLRRVPLDEIAAGSEEILVGTVRETTTVSDEGPHRLLYTEVTFEDLTWLKGDAAVGATTYRFAGGRLGDRRVVVVGMPSFVPGQRVILFANREGLLCDAVGFGQGVFRLGPTGFLSDAGGRPVTGIVDGFPVTGGTVAMRADEFTAYVRSLVAGEDDR